MFTTSVDIANRSLQHVGAPRIASFADISKQAAETGFCYDKVRRAELRRAVWRFATRRAVLRPLTGATTRIIPPAWASGTTYSWGNIVQDSLGVYWVCTVPNTASATNAPGTVPIGQPPYWQQWFGAIHANPYDGTVSYYAGELVTNSGNTYISLINANLGNALNVASDWQQLTGATNLSVVPLIPAGPNVTINGRARNLFPLPYGFLRATYPDPKVESTSTNVTSAGLRFSDWQFENNYLISNTTGPIILRFVADISDVGSMDDLFCEGLAARIAYEVCEPITQSNMKLQAIAAAYQKFIKEARDINWIETGATEPQEEDYELTQGPSGVAESSVAAAQAAQGGNINQGGR